MDFIEYFSHHHLVVHTLRRKGKRTVCGNKVASMLPARGEDLDRAFSPKRKTIIATCFECANGIDFRDE
jgi:hypothetical protein